MSLRGWAVHVCGDILFLFITLLTSLKKAHTHKQTQKIYCILERRIWILTSYVLFKTTVDGTATGWWILKKPLYLRSGYTVEDGAERLQEQEDEDFCC